MSATNLLFAASAAIPLSNPVNTICRCPRRAATALLSTSAQQKIAVAVALPALPITAYSEVVLFTTGCGLPPGPYGLLGAAEGVSYLVVAALVLASLYSKVTTGKGLPEGPGKLLGAAEGGAFLIALFGIGIAAYTAYKFGGLPAAMPTEGSRCFPVE